MNVCECGHEEKDHGLSAEYDTRICYECDCLDYKEARV